MKGERTREQNKETQSEVKTRPAFRYRSVSRGKEINRTKMSEIRKSLTTESQRLQALTVYKRTIMFCDARGCLWL